MFKNCVLKVSVNTQKWIKKASVRAVKTVAQTFVATIGTATYLGAGDPGACGNGYTEERVRSLARGINYRLVEYGFISNASDVKVFNTCMDDIARGTLEAFGIVPAANVKPSATVKPNESVKDTDGKLSVDGHWGPKLTRRLQEIFEAMGYTITIDGKVSNQWACYADENPSLDETAFMWHDEPNGKGSQLIRAMQEWANAQK